MFWKRAAGTVSAQMVMPQKRSGRLGLEGTATGGSHMREGDKVTGDREGPTGSDLISDAGSGRT